MSAPSCQPVEPTDTSIDVEPVDFTPIDRLKRVVFGDGFVWVKIVTGIHETTDGFVLSDGDAIDLAGRIQTRLGFGNGGSPVGLSFAAMGGCGVGIILTLLVI